jgi:hypothetical protein
VAAERTGVLGPVPSPDDLADVSRQLGRPARDVDSVAHRCPCGMPDVVATAPRLSDGTPFPTTFYLTCPRLSSALGTLEADGLMARMTALLAQVPELAQAHHAAHVDYLTRRQQLGYVPETTDISAGGMPERVKCLHALAAHSLAAGPGVNLFGDEALAQVNGWWLVEPCSTRWTGERA